MYIDYICERNMFVNAVGMVGRSQPQEHFAADEMRRCMERDHKHVEDERCKKKRQTSQMMRQAVSVFVFVKQCWCILRQTVSEWLYCRFTNTMTYLIGSVGTDIISDDM